MLVLKGKLMETQIFICVLPLSDFGGGRVAKNTNLKLIYMSRRGTSVGGQAPRILVSPMFRLLLPPAPTAN